jgi:hypothetical protein
METAQFKVVNKVESVESGILTYTFSLELLGEDLTGLFTVTTADPLAADFYEVGSLYTATVTPAV